MTASEVKALGLGFILVSGTAIGALLWRQQHPDLPAAVQLTSAPPAPMPAPPPGPAAKPALLPPVPAAKTVNVQIPPAPEPKSGEGEPPHFDVVRLEPTGDAVLAGKGDPNAKVRLRAAGKIIAETTADSSGHFVILPPTLAPGGYDLTLSQARDGKPDVESTQSVAVAVPAKGSAGQVIVALAEPGKPTRLLAGPQPQPARPPAASPQVAAVSKPPPIPAAAKPDLAESAPAEPAPAPAAVEARPTEAPPATPAPAAPTPAPRVADIAPPQTVAAPPVPAEPPAPSLAIRSVELENGNGFFASGVATPGQRVRVYLNGTALAEVVTGADGQWSVQIKKGLTAGHYAVRADAAGGPDAATAQAEVPFDVPVAMAQAAVPDAKVAASGPAPAPPSAPNPDDVAGLGPQPLPRPGLAASAAKAAKPVPSPAPVPKTPVIATPAAPLPAVPRNPAVAPNVVAETAPPAQPSRANAVIDEVETALVVPGDNLWNISRARLGHGRRFTQIYAANVSQIHDPKLIFPGQVFVVPPK